MKIDSPSEYIAYVERSLGHLGVSMADDLTSPSSAGEHRAKVIEELQWIRAKRAILRVLIPEIRAWEVAAGLMPKSPE